MSIKNADIFVGREKDIKSIIEVISQQDSSGSIIAGEPGIGKTAFVKEIDRRLNLDYNYVVGYHEVMFSGELSTPYISVLESLVKNATNTAKEQLIESKERIGIALKNVVMKKSSAIAFALAKGLATKYLGEKFVKEFEEIGKEIQSAPTALSLANDFVAQHKSEFALDFLSILDTLQESFKGRKIVIIIDQFERAPMTSWKILLDVLNHRIASNLHILLAVKFEGEATETLNSFMPDLNRMDVNIRELRTLSTEEIKAWMSQLGKTFSNIELEEIKKISSGFPFLISEWIKTSPKISIQELANCRGKYAELIKLRIDQLSSACNLFIRKIAVLIKPLSIEDYEKLTETDTGTCSIFIRELEKKWIIIRQEGTVWFRHELIRYSIHELLTSHEVTSYNSTVAFYLKQKFESLIKSKKTADFSIGVSCAYHFHLAKEAVESLKFNYFVLDNCMDTGEFALAEKATLAAIEDAKQLGKKDLEMMLTDNLPRIYLTWGRFKEALSYAERLLDYALVTKNERIEAAACHTLALIKRRTNDDEAIVFFTKSLELKKRNNLPDVDGSKFYLAVIERDRDNYSKARTLFQESLNEAITLQNDMTVSNILVEAAINEHLMGDNDNALSILQKSIVIKERMGDKLGIARAYHQSGIITFFAGEHEKAKKLFLISLGTTTKIGDLSTAAASYCHLGMVEGELGNFETGLELEKKGLEISRKLGDTSGVGKVLHEMGVIESKRENYEAALKLYNDSLEIAVQNKERLTMAVNYASLAQLYEKMDNLNLAMLNLSKAMVQYNEIGNLAHLANLKEWYDQLVLKVNNNPERSA